MKHYSTLLIIALAIISCSKPKANAATTTEQADTTVTTEHIEAVYLAQDSTKIVELLNAYDNGTNLPLLYARKFIGKPYTAHTLEGNAKETLVVNTRGLDCTTLVETVAALTICKERKLTTFQDYLRILRDLRYRQGKLTDYTSRLHYFSDWIQDNEKMGYVKEIKGPNPPFSATQHINACYMTQHSSDYQALRLNPDFLPAIREAEQNLTGKMCKYIPKDKVLDTELMRETIHDGDIIAITCDKPGLEIAHLGFAVWKKDGLHLLNASSLKSNMKVVEETLTLYRYLEKQPSDTGIRVVRIL